MLGRCLSNATATLGVLMEALRRAVDIRDARAGHQQPGPLFSASVSTRAWLLVDLLNAAVAVIVAGASAR